MAPLFEGGRLFIPANERVICLDAYNGTRLWQVDVPGSRRVGVLKDAGHMAVADDYLYIVRRGECWGIETATGEHHLTLSLPPSVGGARRQWGYLAVVGDRLLGTAEVPGAFFGRHCNMCPILEGDFRPVVASEALFCLDRRTGAERWSYRTGLILNSAIAADDRRVYFIEARDPARRKDASGGRIRIDRFLAGGNFLTALDLESGRIAWKRPVQLPYQHIIYLQCARGVVLATGSYNKAVGKAQGGRARGRRAQRVHYGLFAFDADTGTLLWQREFRTEWRLGGSHGEQWRHPVIIGGEIFTKVFCCDLRSGRPLIDLRPGGGRCGVNSGSIVALFYRAGNPTCYDLHLRRASPLNRVSRPGCFINIIPAGGILSIPEASAGCTCGYPIQASFAFVPARGLVPFILPLSRVFEKEVAVTLGPVLPGVVIRYTLDGSDPVRTSPRYTAPLRITRTATIKARLWVRGGEASGVVSARFVRVESGAGRDGAHQVHR